MSSPLSESSPLTFILMTHRALFNTSTGNFSKYNTIFLVTVLTSELGIDSFSFLIKL